MNFDINLATRVYIDFRKVNLILTLVIIMLISWIALSLYNFNLNLEMTHKFGEYKAGKLAGSKAGKISESDYSKFLAEVKSVNAIIYSRSYDWLALLNNLERLVPDGVALKGLEPSGKGEFLKLSATARNFSSIRKFIENLENSKSFTEVYLTDQTSIRTEKQKGINFTVTCRASIL